MAWKCPRGVWRGTWGWQCCKSWRKDLQTECSQCHLKASWCLLLHKPWQNTQKNENVCMYGSLLNEGSVPWPETSQTSSHIRSNLFLWDPDNDVSLRSNLSHALRNTECQEDLWLSLAQGWIYSWWPKCTCNNLALAGVNPEGFYENMFVM